MASRQDMKELGAVSLSLLAERPMHPYEMVQTLRTRGDDELVKVGPGSLYRAIRTAQDQGLARVQCVEQPTGRPERTVYAITAEGREALQDWVQRRLAEPGQEYPRFPLVLSLATKLPWDRAEPALTARLAERHEQRRVLERHGEAAQAQQVPESHLLEDAFRLRMLDAEIGFVQDLLHRVRSGSLVWDLGPGTP